MKNEFILPHSTFPNVFTYHNINSESKISSKSHQLFILGSLHLNHLNHVWVWPEMVLHLGACEIRQQIIWSQINIGTWVRLHRCPIIQKENVEESPAYQLQSNERQKQTNSRAQGLGMVLSLGTLSSGCQGWLCDSCPLGYVVAHVYRWVNILCSAHVLPA